LAIAAALSTHTKKGDENIKISASSNAPTPKSSSRMPAKNSPVYLAFSFPFGRES